jgi:hypothetical protein
LIDVPTGTIKQPGPEQMSKLGVRGAELYADLKSYFDSFSQLDAPSRSHLAGRLHRSLSHEYMMQLAKANE